MQENENILCVEVVLSKYFIDMQTSGAKDVMQHVRGMLSGSGVRKNEIREARKRLGIKTENADGEYIWTWKNPIDPETMWKLKSEEILKCGRARSKKS